MMLINTEIKQSSIHGIGLFAKQFVSKGTVIWRFTPGFDMKFTRDQIKSFPKSLQEYLETYAWLSKKSDLYCFSSDNGKYFNHADFPNSFSEYYENEEEVVTKAVRDIHLGEEITDNYSSFDASVDSLDYVSVIIN